MEIKVIRPDVSYLTIYEKMETNEWRHIMT